MIALKQLTRNAQSVNSKSFTRDLCTSNALVSFINARSYNNVEGLTLLPEFVSVEEEKELVAELNQQLRRRKYEQNHWDNVIYSYKEISRTTALATPLQQAMCQRIAAALPDSSRIQEQFHVLDLSPEGFIDPYVVLCIPSCLMGGFVADMLTACSFAETMLLGCVCSLRL